MSQKESKARVSLGLIGRENSLRWQESTKLLINSFSIKVFCKLGGLFNNFKIVKSLFRQQCEIVSAANFEI